MLRKAFVSLVILLGSPFAGAQSPSGITNIQDFVGLYGFAGYYKSKPASRVKVAVFDVDFSGYQVDLGKLLPKRVNFENEKINPDIDPEAKGHGKVMAEIVYALMTDEGKQPELAPEFYFYQTPGGLDALRDSIASAIKSGVQIILSSDVQLFGSNWDGKGWVNHEVNVATSAGIVWVNAAGNFAHQTFNSPIVFHADSKIPSVGWVNLPDPESSLTFACQAPAGSKCTADVVLSWNSFSEDVRHGTIKDLDLLLIDGDFQNELAESSLEQVATEHGDKDILPKGQSSFSREHIIWVVDPGNYNLMVKSRNPSAFGPDDKLRIVIGGKNILLNHFEIAESLLNPADNPTVVTVGSLDSDRTAVSVKLSKPELMTNSVIKFQDGSVIAGNSNSAAVVAAGFALMKEKNPTLTRQQLLDATSSYPGHMNGVFSLPTK